MYLNLTSSPVYPWISFADTHYDYSHIDQYPSFIWRANSETALAFELSGWAPLFCALVFFLFFGFAQEARKNYAIFFGYITKFFHECVGKHLPGYVDPFSPQNMSR